MREMIVLPVAITGIGVVSALGCSPSELARRFAAGERAAGSSVDGEEFVQIADLPLDLIPAEKKARLTGH